MVSACSSSGNSSSSTNGPDTVSAGTGFVAWSAEKGYVDPDGKPMILGGFAFGNEVWTANEPSQVHHSEEDFLRLRAMGLNTIRFYLSYKFFESDAAPFEYQQIGWDWLDTNVAWAERHGVYLILNMHVPQGGFQSLGEGAALWDIPENQQRLAALWRNIADRYAHTRAIAAYDLVNEPVVSQGKEQWQSLAQRLIDTIRTVDTTHLIFVERMNGIINGAWGNDADMNFVSVTDPYEKTGLTYHFYGPFEFTHQYASWTQLANQDGGNYPDLSRLQISGSTWVSATFSNPTIPTGTSEWTRYTGEWYVADDTSYANIARPTLVCKSIQSGSVYFDSLVIEEMQADGTQRTLVTYDLPAAGNWYFWTEKEGGEIITDSTSVGITGTTSDANYSNADMYFRLQPGFSYRASGIMRGNNVPTQASCLIRLDLEHAQSLQARDKLYLESEIAAYDNIAKQRGVPSYLGEFGAIRYTMTAEKGGLRWVSDMLDILDGRGISYTFHSWHEDNFGLYYGYGSSPIDPSQANQGLIDLFTTRYTSP